MGTFRKKAKSFAMHEMKKLRRRIKIKYSFVIIKRNNTARKTTDICDMYKNIVRHHRHRASSSSSGIVYARGEVQTAV